MPQHSDYLIIGAGIVGLSIARELRRRYPDAAITILEKEDDVARHASSRNSGVLHAGFYYTADSFKARFTVAGNRAWKDYCAQNGLPVNACGKLVVAKDESDLPALHELQARGERNGSNVRLISADEAAEIDPNVRTFREALWSPDTASVDPEACCRQLKDDLTSAGVNFCFNTRYRARGERIVLTTQGEFPYGRLINCAGLYADAIARDFGLARNYTILPFKGLYLKYTRNTTDVTVNIYPVPNLKNPFLGVHYTKTVTGGIKIGPTAIPAFWRENYQGLGRFSAGELLAIGWEEARLFARNTFGFRDLAVEELRKYNRDYFIGLAAGMVQTIDPKGFTEWSKPGIRAQLLDLETRRLVQDFLVQQTPDSIHVLNAVSPAFTCAFPFAAHLVEQYILGSPR